MHIEPHGNGGVRWVDCSEIGLERTMVRAATNFVRRIVNLSGIRVESRERVTFAPTPMKRFHDLQQFHLHWTR
jgi:hypothetical protein